VTLRSFIILSLLVAPVERGIACSCATVAGVCDAAGQSAAVFSGKVTQISVQPAVMKAPGVPRLEPAMRRVRLRVQEVLSGAYPNGEIEILTGFGNGDCGYPFEVGREYVVYARKDRNGRLSTGICSRTRPVEQAAEDLQYIRRMAGSPNASELLVQTGSPISPARPGVAIVAEGPGGRYLQQTDAAGVAAFPAIAAGEYVIHQESDGSLADDPKIVVNGKGCVEVLLPRRLRIAGRVVTQDGKPVVGQEVQLRSSSGVLSEGFTGRTGEYEVGAVAPGDYRLGVNLAQTARQESPYPRWFHPGTTDENAATLIHFDGKPDTRTFDFALPPKLAQRELAGRVVSAMGIPLKNANVRLEDEEGRFVTSASTEADGRFTLIGFALTAYTIRATWSEEGRRNATTLVRIDAGSEPLELRMVADQPLSKE
jgi:hypothetical protein